MENPPCARALVSEASPQDKSAGAPNSAGGYLPAAFNLMYFASGFTPFFILRMRSTETSICKQKPETADFKRSSNFLLQSQNLFSYFSLICDRSCRIFTETSERLHEFQSRVLDKIFARYRSRRNSIPNSHVGCAEFHHGTFANAEKFANV